MDDFDYSAPASVDEAIGLLSQGDGDVRLLAGGTDILVQLRENLRRARHVVDVKKIAELMRLEPTRDGGLWIGAAVPCSRLHADRFVQERFAGLTDASRIIGAWQIQSRASLGGNVCNASPAADSAPILIAYDARLHLAGPSGRRTIPIASFWKGPGQTHLQPGELLVAIELPTQSARSGAHYLRFIPRNEMDIAVVGAGAWIELSEDGTSIRSARIGVGAVAPTPLLAQEAGNWLTGKPANEETFAKAGELARQVARPISDLRGPAEYRVHLVGVLVKRALLGAARRASGARFDPILPGSHGQ